VNIVVGSAFRNSAYRLRGYFDRVLALARHAGPEHTVTVIAAEGDSTDGTRAALCGWRSPQVSLHIVPCDHGGRWFGSTEEKDRMVALSSVGNAIFDAVPETADVLVYVESDLIWDAHTIGTLIDMALRQEEDFDVLAPLVFAGECFYDVWGFRDLTGARFGPFKPYSSQLRAGLTEVSSVGSCLVMRGAVARSVRIRNDYCLVGWCEEARALGYRIGVHPGLRIAHP
jgi:hypothetical protein